VTLCDFSKLASYSVSYEVVKVLQACYRDIFLGSCLNITIFDRLRKTRDMSEVLPNGIDLEYFVDEEICLLCLREMKLLLAFIR